jgi:hypothetical protein
MRDRDAPLDDRHKQLMRELSSYAGDLQKLGVVDLSMRLRRLFVPRA